MISSPVGLERWNYITYPYCSYADFPQARHAILSKEEGMCDETVRLSPWEAKAHGKD